MIATGKYEMNIETVVQIKVGEVGKVVFFPERVQHHFVSASGNAAKTGNNYPVVKQKSLITYSQRNHNLITWMGASYVHVSMVLLYQIPLTSAFGF